MKIVSGPLENEFHVIMLVAGEWHWKGLSCQFSFVSEKIDQKEMSTPCPDDEMGSQVA